MKLKHRLFGLLLALVVLIPAMSVPAFAANGERYTVSSAAQHNLSVAQLADQIEETYAIRIEYPFYTYRGESIAGIYPETLQTLEQTLSWITPHAVRQVSAFYQQHTGYRLRYSYQFAELAPNGASSVELTVGAFDPEFGRIHLYIPRPGEGAFMSGDTPMTIVHEFGHAAYVMIAEQYGYDRLYSEWTAMNGGYSYHPSYIQSNPNASVFYTGYAATLFEEDFAETFAAMVVCNRDGLGLSNRISTNGSATLFGSKVNYLEQLLNTYFSQSATFLQNIRLCRSVSTAISYNGITLSGSYLQFRGMVEPRFMPLGILLSMPGAESMQFTWFSDIGGWVSGSGVTIFPDGSWGESQRLAS